MRSGKQPLQNGMNRNIKDMAHFCKSDLVPFTHLLSLNTWTNQFYELPLLHHGFIIPFNNPYFIWFSFIFWCLDIKTTKQYFRFYFACSVMDITSSRIFNTNVRWVWNLGFFEAYAESTVFSGCQKLLHLTAWHDMDE